MKPQRVLVHVTEEDIANGRRGKCTACPVALALERTFGEPWFVEGEGIRPMHARLGQNYRASRTVARFVDRFDAGDRVKPFSFYVEVP